MREICTGALHGAEEEGGRRAGVLSRLASPRDGCRITNQSTPASERERESGGEQSDKISGERSCQPDASSASLQTPLVRVLPSILPGLT